METNTAKSHHQNESNSNLTSNNQSHDSDASDEDIVPIVKESEMLTNNEKMKTSQSCDEMKQLNEEQYRREVIAQVFGDIGEIKEDFACAVQSKILLQGRLFITESCVCFYSNLFGYEKKIVLPWEGISCITKEMTALVIPNAIAIITGRGEYIFRSFWDRDAAFFALQTHYRSTLGLPPLAEDAVQVELEADDVTVENNDLPRACPNAVHVHVAFQDSEELVRTPSTTGRKTPGQQGIEMLAKREENNGLMLPPPPVEKRTASSAGDENRESLVEPLDIPAIKELKQVILEEGTPTIPRSPAIKARENMAQGGLSLLSLRTGVASEAILTPTTAKRPKTVPDLKPSDTNKQEKVCKEPVVCSDFRPVPVQPGETPVQLLMQAKEAGGSMATMAQGKLSLGLREFFDEFLANNAPFGLADFHSKHGDWDVEITPWAWHSSTEEGATRTLKFVTPITAPIGPSSTLTTKCARLRIYEDAGILMESVLNFADIPNADCFSVFERWLVMPDEYSNDCKPQVSLIFQCDVRFHKNLLWKKIIDIKTRADMKTVFEDYLHRAESHLRRAHAQKERLSELEETEPEQEMEDSRNQEQARRRPSRRFPRIPKIPLPWLCVVLMLAYQLLSYTWKQPIDLQADHLQPGTVRPSFSSAKLDQIFQGMDTLHREILALKLELKEIFHYVERSEKHWVEVRTIEKEVASHLASILPQIQIQQERLKNFLTDPLRSTQTNIPGLKACSKQSDPEAMQCASLQLEKVTERLTELVEALSVSEHHTKAHVSDFTPTKSE